MATSNLANAIGAHLDSELVSCRLKTISDDAFIDRADIVQYIDVPPTQAVYEILRSCLQELIRTKFVETLVKTLRFVIE